MNTIACIGAGYVGGPTMAVIAQQCPETRVIVVDINEHRVRAWASGNPPIFEPGLQEVVQEALANGNLEFSTDVEAAVRAASIIFVSVNTPTKTYGAGAGEAADLQFWESAARQILKAANGDKIVVEKSTLPVRTAQAMGRILNSGTSPHHFEVVSNPEFLAEGEAIVNLMQPDRVLIGGHETERGDAAVQSIVDIYAHWIPRERILTTNVWSSELSKLAANAFLAQRISSINALSAFCEATEADITEVARAIGTDRRIGPRFLNASVGFGGSCFKKDILNLAYLCDAHGLPEVADYWRSVVRMNEWQQDRFVARMARAMFNTLSGKRIAVFGFAFKANTSDTRESAALRVTHSLLDERADVVITDPKALDNAREDLAEVLDQVQLIDDPYAAANGAHAIAVLTEWREYADLDWARIFDSMARPAFVFDGRNILDHQALHDLGFNVYPIGRIARTHL